MFTHQFSGSFQGELNCQLLPPELFSVQEDAVRVRGRGPERNTLFRMVCIVERALAWGPQDAVSSGQLRGWVVCSTSLYHPEDKCRMMAEHCSARKASEVDAEEILLPAWLGDKLRGLLTPVIWALPRRFQRGMRRRIHTHFLAWSTSHFTKGFQIADLILFCL